MIEDYNDGWEFGWGFYLVVVPLIATILVELLIKPSLSKLEYWVYRWKHRIKNDSFALEKLKKWVNFFTKKH